MKKEVENSKPMKPKQENNDPQETFKASGLTLALISALTTRYSSTWVIYEPRNSTSTNPPTIEIGKRTRRPVKFNPDKSTIE